MKVFKFGGASVKDADGVRNLASIIKKTEEQNLVVVVSAMGKMTNALEEVVSSYFSNPSEINACVAVVNDYHQSVLSDLYNNPNHPVSVSYTHLTLPTTPYV